jgi:hypothetical protein
MAVLGQRVDHVVHVDLDVQSLLDPHHLVKGRVS